MFLHSYENVADYLNMKTDKLIRKENFDRYEFDSIVAIEKDATKRFNNLQDQQIEKRTRSLSKNADIDIIR